MRWRIGKRQQEESPSAETASRQRPERRAQRPRRYLRQKFRANMMPEQEQNCSGHGARSMPGWAVRSGCRPLRLGRPFARRSGRRWPMRFTIDHLQAPTIAMSAASRTGHSRRPCRLTWPKRQVSHKDILLHQQDQPSAHVQSLSGRRAEKPRGIVNNHTRQSGRFGDSATSRAQKYAAPGARAPIRWRFHYPRGRRRHPA